MPDDANNKKVHSGAKPAGAVSRKSADADLTCSESQLEDLFAEGESSKPMSKSDKGLQPRRQLKPSR
ncbi:MAG: hypothetical protein ITD36_08690 [Nitrospira sp.]|jgi:hypothetical protein|nr:hypothetical protein [Nitrospira sp.]MDW7654253.1 hypothetical protein [Nitrospiraceae bacterium]MBP0121358.1 hypothetical protein [Nitrospira sp.]MBP0123560.1 hypothetical protein [Nitrospira sp.]MBP0128252.1 hypothetical protein [Nitrospira sp.]